MWKIEKTVKKGDYLYALVKDHPYSTNSGYVLYHRIVMENSLGRLLNSNEVVHHINEDKKDNRLSNLQLMNKKEHSRFHQFQKGRCWVTLKCPNCKTEFEKERNKTFLVKGGIYTCCSRSCSGSFSRFIQLYGETHEVKEAISGNVVAEYKLYSADNREQTV